MENCKWIKKNEDSTSTQFACKLIAMHYSNNFVFKVN